MKVSKSIPAFAVILLGLATRQVSAFDDETVESITCYENEGWDFDASDLFYLDKYCFEHIGLPSKFEMPREDSDEPAEVVISFLSYDHDEIKCMDLLGHLIDTCAEKVSDGDTHRFQGGKMTADNATVTMDMYLLYEESS